MKFIVEPEIFEKWPGLVEAVVIVDGFDNTKSSKEILKLLRDEEKKKIEELKGKNLFQLPQFSSWVQAYKDFGANPEEYLCSVHSLTKRVVEGEEIPNINPMVNLCNFVSLKHLINFGEENLEAIYGDEILKFCQGTEEYVPMGGEKIKYPPKGEIAWVDEKGVTCRRWNWRQNDRVKITDQTSKGYFIIDGLPPIGKNEISRAAYEFITLTKKHLGGSGRIYWLDGKNQQAEIDFVSKKWIGQAKAKKTQKEKIPPKKTSALVDKNGLAYKLEELIYEATVKVVGKSAVKREQVVLEHPLQPEHGDYASSITMKLKRPAEYGSPYDLANAIVNALRSAGLPDYLAKIEVSQPGFINIWLQNDYLISQLSQVLKQENRYGALDVLKGKRFLLEHTSPNPQTTIMLGHLRNNFLGMTTVNLLEFQGAKVTKDCINNNRGIHLCRAIFGYLFFADKKSGFSKKQLLSFRKITDRQIKKVVGKKKWPDLLRVWMSKKSAWITFKDLKMKPDHANLTWYVLGSRAYKLFEEVKKQVDQILFAWEAEDKAVWEIWKQILVWSDKGYQQTYRRVGSIHDWVWQESDHYKQGKEIVKLGLKKGVFKKSQGAIATDLVKYNLPDTVVVKSDGTALYITQDLALTKFKMSKFPSDLYIWDIGNEQSLYFKQLFAICEQLGLGKREQFFHLGYALINFKGGKKMSTRKGEVVKADEVLDILHQRALEIIKSSDQKLRGKMNPKQLDELAEKVAVGAIKYSLLKFSRETTIYFDIDESLALEGNSGPYLQYTFARTQSVLKKGEGLASGELASNLGLNTEEITLLRTIYQFPEVVLVAAQNFAPNLVCNFLYDLAQKYNLFYNRWPILKAEPKELADFRLALTAATGQILKNGLALLGIETPERM